LVAVFFFPQPTLVSMAGRAFAALTGGAFVATAFVALGMVALLVEEGNDSGGGGGGGGGLSIDDDKERAVCVCVCVFLASGSEVGFCKA
jgi:hypothetical protein